jgi:threonine aldolase
MSIVDLRSDTVTKPTPAMRRAMAEAEVGDDVYGEDPTVNRLQDRAAEIFNKEAAIFVPTGSMGNQIAVKLHTRPGTEVVIEERGHMLNYEMAAPAAISGALMRPVRSADGTGILQWSDIQPAVKVGGPYYAAPTALIALENSHNFAGGAVMTAERCQDLCDRAHAAGLPVHLDGARIFNAAAALGQSVAELSAGADSLMFCLSKGLGAPVGSMLLGRKDFITEARVWRKRLGGGMRQAGIIAAAGLLAIEESPALLPIDHANARHLAEGLAEMKQISIDPAKVVTNIVIFELVDTEFGAGEFCSFMAARGVLATAFGPMTVRMVTHYDVSAAGIEQTLTHTRELVAGRTATS